MQQESQYAIDVVRFEDKVEVAKAQSHAMAAELLHKLAENGLCVATAESLTGGCIFSTLVDIPILGKTKYGCFGVYDTDAKRIFLGVTELDVYTLRCASQMAVGILKNSNATFAISVSGNAMPAQGHNSEESIKSLGEVFIGIAGYRSDGAIMVSSHVYNFTEPAYGANNILRLWVETVRSENALHDYLAQQHVDVERFKLQQDGFNQFILTSHIAQFVRTTTSIQAFTDAMDFIAKYKPTAFTTPMANNEVADISLYNNNGSNNKILAAMGQGEEPIVPMVQHAMNTTTKRRILF